MKKTTKKKNVSVKHAVAAAQKLARENAGMRAEYDGLLGRLNSAEDTVARIRNNMAERIEDARDEIRIRAAEFETACARNRQLDQRAKNAGNELINRRAELLAEINRIENMLVLLGFQKSGPIFQTA